MAVLPKVLQKTVKRRLLLNSNYESGVVLITRVRQKLHQERILHTSIQCEYMQKEKSLTRITTLSPAIYRRFILQLGLNPGMQGWLNNQTSINII